jgi:hypothetical protein
MAPTPKALRDVADWLDECTVCEKRHEFILNQPRNPRAGGTWASPSGGHAYFRRAYMTTRNANGIPEVLRRAAAGEVVVDARQ